MSRVWNAPAVALALGRAGETRGAPLGRVRVNAETLRREPEAREQVNRCAKCGRVDVPLNEDELWHYAVTGEGLGKFCPHNRKHPSGCNWKPLYCAVRA